MNQQIKLSEIQKKVIQWCQTKNNKNHGVTHQGIKECVEQGLIDAEYKRGAWSIALTEEGKKIVL